MRSENAYVGILTLLYRYLNNLNNNGDKIKNNFKFINKISIHL